jgi:hypothetical protein
VSIYIYKPASKNNKPQGETTMNEIVNAEGREQSGKFFFGVPLLGDSLIGIAEKAKEAIARIVSSHNPLISHPGSAKWIEPLSEEAYHGLAGDIVRSIEPHSEADPAALLLQFLVCFGNIIGRSAHWIVEGDYHALNLFLLLIGRTAKGRKGTSLNHILKLFKTACEQLRDPWITTCVKEGLSSGEGLIWHVRDAAIVEDQPVSGINDKRLMITESEFASVLKNAGRYGNTLSPTVRRAWDGKTLECLTKNNPAKATDAHISLIGHITEDELKRELTSTEVANGFGNRFLYAYVKRSKRLPHGGALKPETLNSLIERLSQAITFSKQTSTIQRDEETLSHWEVIYEELSEGGDGMAGALTSRAEAQVRRLESIFALLDCSATVRLPHLKAALAVWKFSESSVRAVFGYAPDNPVAAKILDALKSFPEGLTRTQINELFQGHLESDVIEAALQLLAGKKLAFPRTEPTGGRSVERWFSK